MVKPIFAEEQKGPRVKPLFSDDSSKESPKPKVGALFSNEPASNTNQTASIEPATPAPSKRVNAIAFAEPTPQMQVKEGPEAYYVKHPLTKALPKKKFDRVVEIEKNIQLNSSIYVVNYADATQQRVNQVMSVVTEFSLKLLEADMSTWVESLLTELKRMSVDNFRGSKPGKGWLFSQKVPYTVRDYVETYNAVSSKTDTIVSSMDRVVDKIVEKFGMFDRLFEENSDVIEDLDNHVIAGQIALGRHEGQLFKDFATESCHEQFGQKILSLQQLAQNLELNAAQIKLMQNNFMTKLNGVRGVLGGTYPIWKSNFATMLNKWQSSGSVTLDTEIDKVIDLQFSDFIDNHHKLVDGLGKS